MKESVIYHPIISIIHCIIIFGGVNFKLTLFCIKKIYKYNSQKYTAVKFFGINISGEISEEGILA